MLRYEHCCLRSLWWPSRDDILAWALRRSGARSVAALQETLQSEQVETCIMLNVKGTLDRCECECGGNNLKYFSMKNM